MAETYDLAYLAQRAKLGDANAQYRLAALLIQTEGEEERAVTWLRKAAAMGHADARYSLALLILEGRHIEYKPERAVTLLEAVTGQAYMPARRLLGVLRASGYGAKASDPAATIAMLVEDVAAGDAHALREAALLLTFKGEEQELAAATALASAQRGDIYARGLLLAFFIDGTPYIDHGTAADWANALQQAGHPFGAYWSHALTHMQGQAGTFTPVDVPPLESLLPDRERLASLLLSAFGAARTQRGQPLEGGQGQALSGYEIFPAFLPRALCVHLITVAYSALEPYAPGSFMAKLRGVERDLVMVALQNYLRRLTAGQLCPPVAVMALEAGSASVSCDVPELWQTVGAREKACTAEGDRGGVTVCAALSDGAVCRASDVPVILEAGGLLVGYTSAFQTGVSHTGVSHTGVSHAGVSDGGDAAVADTGIISSLSMTADQNKVNWFLTWSTKYE